jgi:tagatose-6-phosphate ketose/aldose isomerase
MRFWEGGAVVTDGLEALLQVTEEQKQAIGIQHTPREIAQQPASWRSTHRIIRERQNSLRQFLTVSGFDQGRPSPETTVFLVGAGTSDYVGRALVALLRRTWGCEVWAVPSTDLLTNPEDLVWPDRKYLWVSFSRSGDSSEGLAVLSAAIEKYPKVRHLLVTCNEKSGMAETCARVPERALILTLDDSVNDRGLAMTSSYSNMVIAGHCLAHVYGWTAYEEIFSTLVDVGQRFLDDIQEAAASIAKERLARACFVGSGVLHAVAQESALKLLELTAGKVQAMSESTLGLRHGPMAALDGDTLFVSFLSQDSRRRKYELDLLKEINQKRLGKVRVVVTPDSADGLAGLADYVFSLQAPKLQDEYRAPVDVMLAQCLGLFSSLAMGLKPDRPSPNGTISRVVSHVSIYP